MLEVGAEAFGADPPTEAEVAAYRGRSLLARAGGVPAGAASRTEIAGGVSERPASACASASAAAGSRRR